MTARFIAGAATPERLPPEDSPEIAFAGRSNVGKSSLLNRIAGQRGLARVSKTPGRTQQINFFALGDRLRLVDLPGYGFARVPLAVKAQWKRLVEHYLTTRRTLRGVVVIVDARRGLEPDDQMLLDFLQAHAVPALLVATKVDKLNRSQRQKQLQAIGREAPGLQVIPFSSLSGEGLAPLKEAVEGLASRERRTRRPREGAAST